MSVRVFAPAKINLTLKVGRPRADGMHPLESAVVFADVGDVVTAAPGEGLSLRIEGEFKSRASRRQAHRSHWKRTYPSLPALAAAQPTQRRRCTR
jgi:4-diphosphocytidyl-2C-methyl-D-erythritol kinase